MSEANIEQLFDRNRLPGGCQFFLLCFYFPLGLVLSFLRFFVGINAAFASTVVPRIEPIRSYVLRTLCLVLGILIREEHLEEKNPDAKLIVSNHTNLFDHLAVDLVLPCVMPNVSDLPQIIGWCFGYKDFGKKQGHETFVENLKAHCQGSNVPILCHPEGATTNGREGLLKFSIWPFCLDQPVNPIVITVTRPLFFDIALSVLASPWWADLFWFFFTPCTIFTLRYLPVMRKGVEETEQDFAKRVQVCMATALNLESTNYTYSDKKEHVKKMLLDQQLRVRRSSEVVRSFLEGNVAEFNTMVDQVREVLPYVPVEVVRRDLVRTRNVDVTITNILEGEISFVPEETRPSTSSRSTVSEPTARSSDSSTVRSRYEDVRQTSAKGSRSLTAISNASRDLDTGASTFGKTAEERMLSFQERKHRLIEGARRRYLDKHDS